MQDSLMEQSSSVLLVEDDPSIRDSLGRYLQHRGFHVATATNGLEGLEQTTENHFDVIISDVMMPEMNGMAFLEEIRKRESSIPVILITGYSDLRIAIDAMKMGAVDFVTKPFHFDAVEQVILSIIKEKKQTDTIQQEMEIQPSIAQGTVSNSLESKIRELSDLYIDLEQQETGEKEDIFQFLVDMARRLTVCDRAIFYVCDAENGAFYRKSYSFANMKELPTQVLFNDQGLVKKITENNGTILLSGKDAFELYSGGGEGDFTDSTALAAPLFVRGEMFGILSVHKTDLNTGFDLSDHHFIQILLRKAALNIENSALYESLYSNMVNTLNSLVQAIEAKDPYTRYHSQRVTSYSCAIAQEMGLNESAMESLRFAAPLHDIGKIGISDAILQKAGKITNEEFATIKTHPTLGDKILEPLGLLESEKAIILHHHERWDGNGYPGNLKGEEIPLLARIVTVADAYDAMTSDRIYRKGRSHQEAIIELNNMAGKQFDENAVKGMVAYCEKMGIQ